MSLRDFTQKRGIVASHNRIAITPSLLGLPLGKSWQSIFFGFVDYFWQSPCNDGVGGFAPDSRFAKVIANP